MSDYSFYEVEKAFTEAMAQAGIPPADGAALRLDGKKHRYKIAGDKAAEKSGEYCCYLDEHPAGYFKSYRASHGVEYEAWAFRSENWQSMSSEERKAYIAQKEEEKVRRDAEEARVRAEAVKLAQMKWANATAANPMHNYALKKGLTSVHGARLLGNELVIPYRNAACEIVTVQTINAAGEKRFQLNAPKLGSFSVIEAEAGAIQGEESPGMSRRVWITEGWATGCSVCEATGDTVIAAADCGNLLPVAKTVRELWPDREFVLAADNDAAKGKGNPGCNAAIKVFEELGIPFCAPDFTQAEADRQMTDWNDFAAARGLAKTKDALLEKLEIMKRSSEYQDKAAGPAFVHVNPSNGRPLGTIENLEALLAFLQIKIGYDVIKKEELLDIPGRRFCGDNAVNAALGTVYSECVRWGFPQKNIDLFLTSISSAHVHNPVRDWIMSEPWDGQDRLRNVCEALELDDNFPPAFRDTLLRRWLLSAVAAVMIPDDGGEEFGCEGTLIIHGDQGIGKTTFFRTLAGDNSEWFGNGLSLDPSQKDSVTPAIKRWIVELGEVDSTFKKSDLSKLKAFLSNTTDVIRAPYGKRSNDYRRRTVFCGTVNQMSFLMDRTGNRRFWCIPVKAIHKIDSADVQQIWAQVYEDIYLRHLAEPGDEQYFWWLSRDERELLNEQNWRFEIPDAVEDMVLTQLDWEEPEDYWKPKTCVQILTELGVMNAAAQTGLCMKAADAIRRKTGQAPAKKHGGRVYLVPGVLPEFMKTPRLY